MYAQENFTMEQPEVPPLPAGWTSVDKPSYLIASDTMNILCAALTIMYAFCFVATDGYERLRFGQSNSPRTFLQSLWYYTLGMPWNKTTSAFENVPGYGNKFLFCVFLGLGISTLVIGIIRMIYDANTDWSVLDYNVPELEGDVNVPISEDTA